jgi:hypothetical protein
VSRVGNDIVLHMVHRWVSRRTLVSLSSSDRGEVVPSFWPWACGLRAFGIPKERPTDSLLLSSRLSPRSPSGRTLTTAVRLSPFLFSARPLPRNSSNRTAFKQNLGDSGFMMRGTTLAIGFFGLNTWGLRWKQGSGRRWYSKPILDCFSVVWAPEAPDGQLFIPCGSAYHLGCIIVGGGLFAPGSPQVVVSLIRWFELRHLSFLKRVRCEHRLAAR